MNHNRKKQLRDNLLFAAACAILAAAVMLGGCNTLQLPGARARAADLAAEVQQKKAALIDLETEWAEAVEIAAADPTDENDQKAEKAEAKVKAKAAETAALLAELEALRDAIAESEKTAAEAAEQAREAAEYLPEPWRTGGLLAMAIGLTWLKGFAQAKVLKQKASAAELKAAETQEAAISVVQSLEGVLMDEQKDAIKQGPKAKALVDKAQGRI